jgi:hypothetical protein
MDLSIGSNVIEEMLLPDDFSDMLDGNANTAGDASFGDFVYQQQKVGNVTRNIRRPVVTDQTGPLPFPENVSAPYEDPDLENMKNENPRNGTTSRDPSTLPPLQKKIDEAEAILKALKDDETKHRSRSREKEL